MEENQLPGAQYDLEILLSKSNNALFVVHDCVSEENWQFIESWWSVVAFPRGIGRNREFEVHLADFNNRKKWLKDYWVDAGLSIKISENLRIEIDDLKKQIKNFELHAFENWEPSSSEIESFNPNLKRPLTNFQIRNVLSLLRMENGANFSVPGAGKTSTALALWNELRKTSKLSKLLVIAPRSAFDAWLEESVEIFQEAPNIQILTEVSISPEVEILIVNYEQLENENRLNRIINWVRQSKTMLVIDEAHRIKGGGNSVRWRACKRISVASARTELLTGTPLPQGLEDLQNLLKLSWNKIPADYFHTSKLHKLKRGGAFVRTTKNELGLPPVEIKEVHVPMGDLQSQIYSALGRSYSGQFQISQSDSRYFQQRGKAVFTLLAVASNPGLLMGPTSEFSYLNLTWPPRELQADPWLRDVVRDYAQLEMPQKYKWLANMVRERAEANQKVLVWSNFVGNLHSLEKLLKPFNPAKIYGGTNAEDRKFELNRFRNSKNCTVLLTNPQTLGEGVTVHKVCHEAVYLDRSYNAGHYLQSVDRIHRLGLEKNQNTKIHFLISSRTIDERVQNRLRIKIDRLAKLMNDAGLVEGTLPNTLEDQDLAFSGLDSADFNDLFKHLKNEL